MQNSDPHFSHGEGNMQHHHHGGGDEDEVVIDGHLKRTLRVLAWLKIVTYRL